MDSNFERKEKPVISKVLNKEEMIDLIYAGESLPQNKDFKDDGRFKYFDIKNLLSHNVDSVYPILKKGDNIIGLSELQVSPYDEKTLWIMFVSIAENFRGQGNASRLIEDIFRYAKDNNFKLENSSYNEDGDLKLKNKFLELAEKYNVPFIARGNL